MIEIIIFSIIFIFLLNFILFKLLNIDSIQNKIILVVISSVIIYYYLSRSELHLPLVQYKFVKYSIGIFLLLCLYYIVKHIYMFGYNHVTSIMYIVLVILIVVIVLSVYYFNTEFDSLYRHLYKRLNNRNNRK